MEYMPEQGDIVFLEFEKDPVLIVSNNIYNNFTQMVIACPIKNITINSPLYVKLSSEIRTTGVILCEQIKTLNIKNRNITFYEKISTDILEEVIDILQGSIEII